MPMKYYAVKEGENPGIYESWEECQANVVGYKGAIYKSFKTKEEAQLFLEGKEQEYSIPTFFIDGSYDKTTESYSFGGVLINQGQITQFKKAYPKDEYSSHRNVAGEIKGAAYVINYAIKQGYQEINLCYDYIGIEKWFLGEWKANTPIALAYVRFRDQVYKQIKVNFIKIKSHSSNKYNDLADELAKEALGIK